MLSREGCWRWGWGGCPEMVFGRWGCRARSRGGACRVRLEGHHGWVSGNRDLVSGLCVQEFPAERWH